MFYEDTPTASAFSIGKSTIYLSLNCFHQAVPVTNEGYSFFWKKCSFSEVAALTLLISFEK